MNYKPLIFLLVSCLLILAAVTLVHQAEVIQAQAAEVERAEHLQEVEMERQRVQAELDAERQARIEAEREREEAERERQELQTLINQQAETYLIATTGLTVAPERETLSRSGREATITATTMSIDSASGFTAEMFEQTFRAYGAENLYGLGEALVAAEAEYGVNALVLCAMIIHESGWGRSWIAQNKNNLAGIGAYDSNPGKYAHSYNDKADSVFACAKLLREQYLTAGGHSFNGDTLQHVNIRYASDQQWAAKVGATMRTIAVAAVDDPGALLAAAGVRG